MTHTLERYLNSLPEDILTLDISSKGIKSLPDLTKFKNFKKLYCYDNQLTYLPTLPQNLEILYCDNNQLTSLPTLPQNLEKLHCFDNKLAFLPSLPQNIIELYCHNNPISKIVNSNFLFQRIKNIQILNHFRYLYYCLKFKKHFRKWLWEKVSEPNVNKMYNPIYLIENLGDEDDLESVLDNWK